MSNTDPAERMARVRELFAKEQAKLTGTDHNGNPIPPPVQPGPTGVPAPNPALGASASGPPDASELEAARKSGDWRAVLAHLRDQLPPDAA